MGNLGNRLIQIGQYCDCLQPITGQVEDPQIQVKQLSDIQIEGSIIDHDFQKQLQIQHHRKKQKNKKRKLLSKQQIQNKLIISQKINQQKTQDSLLIDQIISFKIQKNEKQIPATKYSKSKVNKNRNKQKVVFQQQQKTQTNSQNLNQFKKNKQEINYVNYVSKQIVPQNKPIKFSILDQLSNDQKIKRKQYSNRLIVKQQRESECSSLDSDHKNVSMFHRPRRNMQLQGVIDLQKLPKTNKNHHRHQDNLQKHQLQKYKNQKQAQQLQDDSIEFNMQSINAKKQSVADSFSLNDYFLDDKDKDQFDHKHQKQQIFN